MGKWLFFVAPVVIYLVFFYSEESQVSTAPETVISVPQKTQYVPTHKPIAPAAPVAPSQRVYMDTEYQPTFNGYECTDDCSGHEAGYEWAAENGIEDPEDCGGNSNSFIEGCQSYAEEMYEEDVDDYDDNYGSY